jgi:pimeloyl-ACP methyl ester carboxylesterase
VVLRLQDIDEDYDDEHRGGVHGVFGRPNGDASWGTIAAWAWGASRVLDVVSDIVPEIDANRIAVVGHSRGGKTALWAAATDSRFAMAVSNNSGCAGAALSRGAKGETVGEINVGFPHWFSTNYRRYGKDPYKLPIDQHQLLGLIAPRLLYVASATEDAWADPQGEWLSTLSAGSAWKDPEMSVGWDAKLNPDQPVHAGRVGYHLRTGRHSLTRKDWEFFSDFAAERL